MKKLALSILLITSSPALAQSQQQQTDVIGLGTSSCGYWNNARRDNSFVYLALQSWVLGALSGMNISSEQRVMLNGVDGDGIISWMDHYCSSHPLERVSTATLLLANELARR